MTITTEDIRGGLDIIDWKLSNGIRVLLKTTDFKDDEVLFAAVSPGGSGAVDLLAMFIGTGLKPDVVSSKLAEPAVRVGNHR